jgi:hypothetical protein
LNREPFCSVLAPEPNKKLNDSVLSAKHRMEPFRS